MDDEDQGVCREFADWEGGRGGEEGAGGGCQGVIVDVMRSWFMSWSQRVRISPAGCILDVGIVWKFNTETTQVRKRFTREWEVEGREREASFGSAFSMRGLLFGFWILKQASERALFSG